VNENRGLTGKIAIVFGGSRGIGAAAARRLAREGADVTVTYVSTPERAADTVAAIEATGRTGLAIKADSADPAAIKAAVAQTVDHFGKLDIAVVNAGISMTKAAVAVMVKGIAVDLASRGITVNNIQPGPTVTDMTVDHIEALKPLIPLKRAGDPDEIAALVAYLAGKE
jgi:3-oxoacyl-[acyl-carrier protein] reductase